MTPTNPEPRPTFDHRPVSPLNAHRLTPTPQPVLIGSGAGRAMPTDNPSEDDRSKPPEAARDASNSVTATPLKVLSVWLPEDLRSRLDASIPGVHRHALVMAAYDRHHPRMLTGSIRRPGRASPGIKSRNWTVRVHHDEHLELQALADHLQWPVSSLIKKLLELEVAWEETCHSTATRTSEA